MDVAHKVVPPKVSDRSGWAEDIAASFAALSIPPSRAKSVQSLPSSNRNPDGKLIVPYRDYPTSPGVNWKKGWSATRFLPLSWSSCCLSIVQRPTYGERLARVRTEHELTRIYEDMIGIIPLGIGELLFGSMNPVRTGGPMQVNINFAAKVMRERPYPWSNAGSAREEVFTRLAGCISAPPCCDYPVSYDRMLYRFADYNAGRYASRNAVFQHLVAALSGRTLDFDGDLGSQTQAALEHISVWGWIGLPLSGTCAWKSRSTLNARPVRAGSCPGRAAGNSGRSCYRARHRIKSPKITRKLSTKWFANRVGSDTGSVYLATIRPENRL